MCTVGDQCIEVIELADPDPISKAILASIVAVMRVSSPALLALSTICSNEAATLNAADQAALQKLGLVKKDGTVSDLVANVVKQTVTVTPK